MTFDPMAGSAWSQPESVAGFRASPPNTTLLTFAAAERSRVPEGAAIDIGCGAGRNLVPLAGQGWRVLGLDWSWPMLTAAAEHAAEQQLGDRVRLGLCPMDDLGARDNGFDLIVAHGIWNLARSAAEFRRGVEEAARVARPSAGLFVFTFSRNTLPADALPLPGEPFTFTQFSGQPQCFLTKTQLIEELGRVGFVADATIPFAEHNVQRSGGRSIGRGPVIYEAAFRLG
jgi:SAM-dependent methyltransferase